MRYQRRTSINGGTASGDVSTSLPHYLRLVRRGDTITASVSPDGTDGSWTDRGTRVLDGLTATAYVGLAMSSHSPGNPGTATFDHVALTPLVDRSEEPTLLTLYDFVPEIEHPTLLGHWKLDETRTAAPPIMANTQVELRGGSVIDGYDSAAGAYTGATTDAWVYCRNTVARSIHLYNTAGILGDVWTGAGTTPNDIIRLNQSSYITGSQSASPMKLDVMIFGAPTGYPASVGPVNLSGGTIIADNYADSQGRIHCDSLSLSGGRDDSGERPRPHPLRRGGDAGQQPRHYRGGRVTHAPRRRASDAPQ